MNTVKLLVVEDEIGLREALIHSLRQEGYLADGAGDGDEGLELIETGVYDLVILDVMLPGRSGLEVLRSLREGRNAIPVILLTALSELDDKVRGMDSGADDYLTKPFALPELLARIRMVSRRRGEAPVDNDLHMGCLVLETDSRDLLCSAAGRRVRLGGKEYQLMEYLMRNPGQILSREQITEKIWGYDSEAEYNNVDVYISFLRKKLSFVGADVQIQAVRGVGYALRRKEDKP